MSDHLPGPFGFGDLLDAAFGIYRRNFLTLFGTTLLLMVPFMAVNWFALPYPTGAIPADPAAMAASGGQIALVLLVAVIVFAVLWGGLTRQASQALMREPVSIGDGLGEGFRSLLRLVLAFIVTVIAMYAGVLILALVAGLAMALIIGIAGGEPGATSAALMLGMGIASFVAVLFWAASFFALAPAVVVERLGPFAAIKRSWTLSNGGRLRILGILAVTWVILMLPTVAAVFVTTFVGAAQPMSFVQPGPAAALIQTINFGLTSLTLPFFVAVVVTLYYDRRARKEAPDIGEPTVDEFAPAY